jgi:LysR family hydrogen peroxide-inducible transcriptional activator
MADLKLKDLRYLVALADERHFGRAARKSCVSQPTLSAQLRKLEDYLGVPLIERQPRRVALTEAGQQVVARARRILQDSDEIVAMARHSSDPLTGTLKVAFIPTIGPYLLPRVAPRLRKALPRLKLLLFEHQTAVLLERLHAGAIDLGILALPVDLSGLESRVLFESPSRSQSIRAIRWRNASRCIRRTWTARRYCCSRTVTACEIRHSKCARVSTCMSRATTAPRA